MPRCSSWLENGTVDRQEHPYLVLRNEGFPGADAACPVLLLGGCKGHLLPFAGDLGIVWDPGYSPQSKEGFPPHGSSILCTTNIAKLQDNYLQQTYITHLETGRAKEDRVLTQAMG